MTKLKVLSLFAGIGGFDLGLERTGGFETVAFCEINKAAQKVLRKHWPEVPIYDDVTQLTAERLAADGIAVDVIAGGFPCQDLSIAQGSTRAGLEGERSGLWFEYARLIDELRPRYIIVENVVGLLSLGFGRVLRSLAEIGYDAQWDCIPAAAVGAPHIRDRFWLVGYPHDQSQSDVAKHDEASGLSGMAANANGPGRSEQRGPFPIRAELTAAECCRWWEAEPPVGRVVDGLSGRVDRLKQLGNAVVPQIPELIGRAILVSLEQDRQEAA